MKRSLLVFSILFFAMCSQSSLAQDCWVNQPQSCNQFISDTCYANCEENPFTQNPLTSRCWGVEQGSSCGDKYTSNGSGFSQAVPDGGVNSRRSKDFPYLHECGLHYRCKCSSQSYVDLFAKVCEQVTTIQLFVELYTSYGEYCNPYGY